MKHSIGKTAAMCGVSVRTVRYYDQMGLLAPSEVTESGYRLYDDDALERLQEIVFLRGLDMSLEEIRTILGTAASPEERAVLLGQHRDLLLLERRRLDGIISAVERTIGGLDMKEVNEFVSNEDIERRKKEYANEVRERWGGTPAYEESQKREHQRTGADRTAIEAEADAIFDSFAALAQSGADASGSEAHAAVERWREHISRHYYECTTQILACLGEMYTADERFTANLDAHGEGTAAFMSAAIREYCAE